MENSKYIAYYRASTESQRDGIGLEVQAEAVARFLRTYGGRVIDVVSEIISGGAQDRAGFNKALALCKQHDAILIVHRIDRLSRAGFMTIAKLEEEGVPFIEADSPHDSDFSKNIKFLVAKEEKEKTQRRVKDALGQIKDNIEKHGFHITKEGKEITSLGSPQNLTEKSRERSKVVRRAKAIANENNRRAYAMASRLRPTHSLGKIADALNSGGFKTSRGNKFYAVQVSNLIKLYEDVPTT
jgi:DNA invertase Pin-like site-specific DNA recombinase